MKITKMRNRICASVMAGLFVVVTAGGIPGFATANNVDIFASNKLAKMDADSAVASAKSLSTAFRAASEKVLPSLVAIEVKPKTDMAMSSRRQAPPMAGNQNPFNGTPFEKYFEQAPQGNGQRPPPKGHGIGSGVIINDEGLVLTNNHVVRGGGDITIRLHDGREFKAANVWTDPKTDLALVQISNATDLVAAKIADSDKIEVGDWVLALGQPFGLESTVTAGIISAKHRGIGITDRENFLQTDAAINPGNSGGPLVDLDGQVVGINTAISSHNGGNDGIGFAIPINLAKWVANELYNNGQVQRGFLGVNIQTVSAELANRFDVAPRQGVLVSNVVGGSPAEEAGLQVGDVILSLAGQAIDSPRALQLAVERAKIGTPASLKVTREGKSIEISFVPREPTGADRAASDNGTSRLREFGFELQKLTPELAEKLGVNKASGLVITAVAPNSVAAEAGLQPGMIISRANHQELNSVGDLAEILTSEKANDGILLLVHSKLGSHFVVLKPA